MSAQDLNFYEALDKPIFVANKMGQISYVNEAGRNLLREARLSVSELQFHLKYILESRAMNSDSLAGKSTIYSSNAQKLHLTMSILPNSDKLLLEVRR